jgi:hypothetical protein
MTITTTAYDAWKMEKALKLHFQGSYDYFKYKGKLKDNTASEKMFNLSPEKRFFEISAKKYKEKQELMQFFVSNLVLAEGDMRLLWGKYWATTEANEIYKKWKNGLNNFEDIVRKETKKIAGILAEEELDIKSLFAVNEGHQPLLLKLFYASKVSLETVMIYDNCLFPFIENWKEKVKETIMFPDTYKNIKNYEPFFDMWFRKKIEKNEVRKIVKNEFGKNS